MKVQKKSISVQLIGRDEVSAVFFIQTVEGYDQVANFQYQATGCSLFLKKLYQFQENLMKLSEFARQELLQNGVNRSLEIQKLYDSLQGGDHVSILLRELVLRLQDRFELPYTEEELCHCRAIPTAVVDRAIVGGCHSIQAVARTTSAGTSCGTCRPDSEKIIRYRLGAL